MQQVSLNVADNLTVQVNLVQMAGTIIQFVDGRVVAMQLPSLSY
ncbi:hypothetical protein [Snodgrassella sp. ESL0323]|nr:hypothetical protein [Snodgrassella sp. ESL0323]